MRVNLEKDKYFLDLANQGIFNISQEGVVTRVTTGFQDWSVNSGYKKVHFKNKSILLHRLVWLYFKGTMPNNLVINHKDGIKTNCKLSNLELVTQGQNLQHAFDTKLRIAKGTSNFGQINGKSLFKDDDVITLRLKFSSGTLSIEQIAEDYNIRPRSVRNMLWGITYSHLPHICTFQVRRGRRPNK